MTARARPDLAVADNIHEMSRAIGSLEEAVKTFKETWVQQDIQAAAARGVMYAKVDDLKSQQAVLASKVERQTAELAELKPAIERFEAQRQREEGARSLVKLIWIAVTAFATGLGYVGHELLINFWPPKH